MADGPFGVEPKIVKLPNGLLVISTGRQGQFLWVADDPPESWTPWNVAAHHNRNFAKGAPPGGEEIYQNLTYFESVYFEVRHVGNLMSLNRVKEPCMLDPFS